MLGKVTLIMYKFYIMYHFPLKSELLLFTLWEEIQYILLTWAGQIRHRLTNTKPKQCKSFVSVRWQPQQALWWYCSWEDIPHPHSSYWSLYKFINGHINIVNSCIYSFQEAFLSLGLYWQCQMQPNLLVWMMKHKSLCIWWMQGRVCVGITS